MWDKELNMSGQFELAEHIVKSERPETLQVQCEKTNKDLINIDRATVGKSWDDMLDWNWEQTEKIRWILSFLIWNHKENSSNENLKKSLLTSWNPRVHFWTDRPVINLKWAVNLYKKSHENDEDFLGNPDKDFLAYLDSDKDLYWLFDILDLPDSRKILYKKLYEEVWNSPIKEIKLPNNNILYVKCENKNWMWNNHYARYWIVHLALAESLKLITPWDGKTIVEMTSWSSWCSLAKACNRLWFKLEMFVPDNFPYGRKHPIQENEKFVDSEYIVDWDDNCTKIIECPKYIDWTREVMFWKYLSMINSQDCLDIYSPDHASEKFNLILKVFWRIAKECLESEELRDENIDYAVLARGNGTSTKWMADVFKSYAKEHWIDTRVIAFAWKSKMFWLLSPDMKDGFVNNIDKMIKDWCVDELKIAELDKDRVYELFKDYPEVKSRWDSTLLWLSIIADMANEVEGKTFFSVVYDWREKYLSEEELKEYNNVEN